MTRSTSRPDEGNGTALWNFPTDPAYLDAVVDEVEAADAVSDLCAVLARCSGPIWNWGDGSGGYVHELLNEAALAAGLPPARARFHPPDRVELLARRDGWLCAYCHTALGWGHPSVTPPEVDHVIPRSRSGTDALDNLVLACGPCNRAKGNRLLEEWIRP